MTTYNNPHHNMIISYERYRNATQKTMPPFTLPYQGKTIITKAKNYHKKGNETQGIPYTQKMYINMSGS